MRTEILSEAEDELNESIAHGRRRPEYWLKRTKKIG